MKSKKINLRIWEGREYRSSTIRAEKKCLQKLRFLNLRFCNILKLRNFETFQIYVRKSVRKNKGKKVVTVNQKVQ